MMQPKMDLEVMNPLCSGCTTDRAWSSNALQAARATNFCAIMETMRGRSPDALADIVGPACSGEDFGYEGKARRVEEGGRRLTAYQGEIAAMQAGAC